MNSAKTINLSELVGKELVESMHRELEGARHDDARWASRFAVAGPKSAPRWGNRFIAAATKTAPSRD